MSEDFDVLIVGGGQGGAAAAMALRHNGFGGSVAIVGEEAELPYDRPPLSKDYLAGEKPFERMIFRSAESWAERGIELRLGAAVAEVRAGARRVRTEGGGWIGYRKLIWAAGGRPLPLRCPGEQLAGVHAIRSKAGVDRILSELPGVERVVVIGGGYVGLEAAAVLRKLGKQVILLEAKDRVLNRVAGEPLSRFYEAAHREQGVTIRLNESARCLHGGGRVEGVELQSGELVPADLVVVGIGIAAADGPLAAAGAATGNGVRVDGQCRTSLPDVYAIGDCAEHQNFYAGGRWIRLESVQNAHDQASVAAKSICGAGAGYDAVPWFWSNQYGLRLQTVGLSQGCDDLLTRGDPASGSFSVIYLRDGRVVALDCVNATRDYVQGRGLVTAGVRPDRAALADPAVPLKSLA